MNQPINVSTPYADSLMRLVRGIVADPDDVVIEWQRLPRIVLCTISAGEASIGRLIGKGGANARALQTVFNRIADRYGDRLRLHVAGGVGNLNTSTDFEPNRKWDRDHELKEIVEDLMGQVFEKEIEVKIVVHGDSTQICFSKKYNAPMADELDIYDAMGLLLKMYGNSQGRKVFFHADQS